MISEAACAATCTAVFLMSCPWSPGSAIPQSLPTAEPPVDAQQGLDVSLLGKVALYPLSAPGSKVMGDLGMIEQMIDASSHLLDIVGTHQVARDTILEPIRDPADIKGHDRPPVAHGFEPNKPERLRPDRRDDHHRCALA